MSSRTMTRKPYQQRKTRQNRYERKLKQLWAGRDAYESFMKHVLGNAKKPTFVAFEKKSKMSFPRKDVFQRQLVSDAPLPGDTATAGQAGNANNDTVQVEKVKRTQHLMNQTAAPFQRFTRYTLKTEYPHLRMAPGVGKDLDQIAQGFTQFVVKASLPYTTKSFKIDERAVLNGAHKAIDMLSMSNSDDAHLLAKRMNDVLTAVENELDTFNEGQLKETGKRSGKSTRRSYIAERLNKKYKPYIGLQPHSFETYLDSIVGRAVNIIQGAAQMILNLLVSSFIYHTAKIFGALYKKDDASDKVKDMTKTVINAYFSPSFDAKEPFRRVTTNPRDEHEVMQRLPLFAFMHRIWNIPQTSVRYRAKRRARKTADATATATETETAKGPNKAKAKAATAASATATKRSKPEAPAARLSGKRQRVSA